MTKIGIVSDTHVGEENIEILENVSKHFKGVDLILHAGDVTQQKVLNELSTIAPVIAVKGNADSLDLNLTEIIIVNNFKIALNHGMDLSDNYEKLYEFGKSQGADIVITGHTHKPHFKFTNNMCLVNPESLNKPIDSKASVAILNIDKEEKLISNIKVNIIELEE